MLTRLAQRAGLVEQDAIGLLRAYGRDVAGVLQIWDPERASPGPPDSPPSRSGSRNSPESPLWLSNATTVPPTPPKAASTKRTSTRH